MEKLSDMLRVYRPALWFIFALISVVTAACVLYSFRQSHSTRTETRSVNLYKNFPDSSQWVASIPSPTPSSYPSYSGTPQLDSIEINWPKEMEITSSGFIILRVKERQYQVSVTQQPSAKSSPDISPLPTPSPVATINRVGHESKIAAAVAVPTPPVISWWVTEELHGVAQLTGSNFNIAPATPASQKLENGFAEWRWNISPKETGTQIINASLEIQFVKREDDLKGSSTTSTPKSGGIVWLEDLPIKTYKSWFTKDTVTISSIVASLTALIGALGLSIPWLIDKFRERRQESASSKGKIGFRQ